MRKVERPWRGERRKQAGRAQVQREIAQHEESGILLETVRAYLVLLRCQGAFSRQADEIASRLEDEEHAGKKVRAGHFRGQALRPFLGQQDAEICRGIQVEPAAAFSLA